MKPLQKNVSYQNEPFWSALLCRNSWDTEFCKIPNECGVYFIVEHNLKDNGKYRSVLIYIGSSGTLYKRFSTHLILTMLNKEYVLWSFHYQLCQDYSVKEIEFIQKYTPPYNKDLYGAKRKPLTLLT